MLLQLHGTIQDGDPVKKCCIDQKGQSRMKRNLDSTEATRDICESFVEDDCEERSRTRKKLGPAK
ncbi:hypothetical protein KIN20_016071 [Parelaphostrongylus tenuis]|uniref:Uncharacterized protein n=1 Tax=Parelaphostrongylus tenuis TaxID=148309 RepID=A0AAD5N4V5_PARTN|nr:hypothetical protein KIN20_016071 [Parelaphostrongylus tenuis]